MADRFFIWTLSRPTGAGVEGGRRLQGIELREGTDAVLMVGYAACLAATVHAEDGIAHIDTAQGGPWRPGCCPGCYRPPHRYG